ncbi:MAG: GNAT family N-acetyltransferase [Lachnospiraceae bacterium]|nr:GNAT family N-acetyltransferase [Lachnospiraceae bacterium]
MKTRDIFITNFSDKAFQEAFRQYFAELDVSVRDWDGLFREMNAEGTNRAYVRVTENGDVVGFIFFAPIMMQSWFFEMPMGFIREFWVSQLYRNAGHGSELLRLAEEYFLDHDISRTILTTDTAEEFYRRRGYGKASDIRAKNQDDVFVKQLGDRKGVR